MDNPTEAQKGFGGTSMWMVYSAFLSGQMCIRDSLDGAHKPRQQEHQQHEPKAPPHREENQAQDIPGAGGHDHTGSADRDVYKRQNSDIKDKS